MEQRPESSLNLRSLLCRCLFLCDWEKSMPLAGTMMSRPERSPKLSTSKSQRAGSKKQSQGCPGGCWGHLFPRLELPLASHHPLPRGWCPPPSPSWMGRGYRFLQLAQLLLQLAQLLSQLPLDVLLRLQCAGDLHVLISLDREKQSAATHCSWRPQNLLPWCLPPMAPGRVGAG